MAGIDHSRADVDVRQCFAFTRKAMAAAMEELKQNREVKGCVMLSTCNRMELWVSLKEGAGLDLVEILCGFRHQETEENRDYFCVREQEAAIEHLFFLSAGMKSQILGEDQILSQVKEALAFAREQECTDHVLEVLFRMAVTAGKQVKTEVAMDKANFSAAHQAIRLLKEQGRELAGKKTLVIGNGEMGRITASALMEEGAEVTVTVRQYRSGFVNIPKGADRMNYGDRYAYIPECDYIFSATASPNLTITRERLEECAISRQQVYVDLAVPRDVEESVGGLNHIVLYDMDDLKVDVRSEQMKEQYRQAECILRRKMQEFYDWQDSRDLVPRIQNIGADSGKEFCWRMEKEIRKLEGTQEEKELLKGQMEKTVGKVVDKLLFTLKDQMDTDMLRQCVEILESVYGTKD